MIGITKPSLWTGIIELIQLTRMTTLINITMAVILMSLTGSCLLLAWYIFRKIFDNVRGIAVIYYFLKGVTVSFLIPVVYVILKCRTFDFEMLVTISDFFGSTIIITKVLTGVSYIWAFGTCVVLMLYIKERLQFRQIRLTCTDCLDKNDIQLFNQCKEKVGIKRKIALKQGRGIFVPITAGIFHPCVYIPTILADDRKEVIFLHELTHCKHHDVLFKHIALFTAVIHWANPFIWILKNEINCWTESYCDYSVCQVFKQPKLYCSVLVDMAIDLTSQKAAVLKMSFLEDKESVKIRIKRMKKYYHTPPAKISYMILCLCLLVAGSGCSVYAASSGVLILHNYCVEKTAVDIEQPDNVYVQEQLDEYQNSEEQDDKFNIITVDGEEIKTEDDDEVYGSTWEIYWKLKQNEKGVFSVGKLSEGDTLSVFITFDASDEPLMAGIITPNGKQIHVSKKKLIDHTFKIKETGEYKVFIANTNQEAITIAGYANT